MIPRRSDPRVHFSVYILKTFEMTFRDSGIAQRACLLISSFTACLHGKAARVGGGKYVCRQGDSREGGSSACGGPGESTMRPHWSIRAIRQRLSNGQRNPLL